MTRGRPDALSPEKRVLLERWRAGQGPPAPPAGAVLVYPPAPPRVEAGLEHLEHVDAERAFADFTAAGLAVLVEQEMERRLAEMCDEEVARLLSEALAREQQSAPE